MQVLDSVFQSIETHGKRLLSAGVLQQSDVDGALKGNKATGKIMIAGLPAYCNFLALVRSAKSNSTGILLCKLIITNKFSCLHEIFVKIMSEKPCYHRVLIVCISHSSYLPKHVLVIFVLAAPRTFSFRMFQSSIGNVDA